MNEDDKALSSFRQALEENRKELESYFKGIIDSTKEENENDFDLTQIAEQSASSEERTANKISSFNSKLNELLNLQNNMLLEIKGMNNKINSLSNQQSRGNSLAALALMGMAPGLIPRNTGDGTVPQPGNNTRVGDNNTRVGDNNTVTPVRTSSIDERSIPPVSPRTTYDMSSPIYTTEDMSIRDLTVPQSSSSPYGITATQNQRGFEGIVFHHTGQGTTGEGIARYGQRVDEQRGGAFGYHFLITPDGEIIQAAPMDVRTNHIGPIGSGRNPDLGLGNENTIGISLIAADEGATERQLSAAVRLGESLSRDFGISPDMITSHGEFSIPGHRMETEGVEAADVLRRRLSEEETPTPETQERDTRIPSSVSEKVNQLEEETGLQVTPLQLEDGTYTFITSRPISDETGDFTRSAKDIFDQFGEQGFLTKEEDLARERAIGTTIQTTSRYSEGRPFPGINSINEEIANVDWNAIDENETVAIEGKRYFIGDPDENGKRIIYYTGRGGFSAQGRGTEIGGTPIAAIDANGNLIEETRSPHYADYEDYSHADMSVVLERGFRPSSSDVVEGTQQLRTGETRQRRSDRLSALPDLYKRFDAGEFEGTATQDFRRELELRTPTKAPTEPRRRESTETGPTSKATPMSKENQRIEANTIKRFPWANKLIKYYNLGSLIKTNVIG